MPPYETERELTEKSGDYVKHVRIRRATDDKYPSGYDYTFHYGTVDGEALLRYDNAHETQNGHERHTPDGVEEIELPGIEALLSRFESEIETLPP
jgi:hypothetical protein